MDIRLGCSRKEDILFMTAIKILFFFLGNHNILALQHDLQREFGYWHVDGAKVTPTTTWLNLFKIFDRSSILSLPSRATSPQPWLLACRWGKSHANHGPRQRDKRRARGKVDLWRDKIRDAINGTNSEIYFWCFLLEIDSMPPIVFNNQYLGASI